MPSKFVELDVPFSTADVSRLDMAYTAGSLTVTCADYRGVKTSIVFHDVVAYKWDESSFERIDASPDRAYRVDESDWLAHWPERLGYTHYALGFCGLAPIPTGYLEVIAKKMEPGGT